MKYRNTIFVCSLLFVAIFILQSHADGRATRNRDNTGAPNGQTSGNGVPITCQNCHDNANFEVGINLELLDLDDNPVTEYQARQLYTARVTIETLSGNPPAGYGFQMVSLLDADVSDVNGWMEGAHSENVQITPAASTGRVYAEHHSLSTSNEFTAQWQAPDLNSGDVSFYVAGLGANGNSGSGGDHAPTPIQITFSESFSTNTSKINEAIAIDVFPNPSVDQFNVSGDLKNKRVELYHGQKHLQSFHPDQDFLIIPINDYAPGVYFILIKNEHNQILNTSRAIKF